MFCSVGTSGFRFAVMSSNVCATGTGRVPTAAPIFRTMTMQRLASPCLAMVGICLGILSYVHTTNEEFSLYALYLRVLS